MKTLVIFMMLLVCFTFVSTVFSAGLTDIAYSPYTISREGSYIVVSDLTTSGIFNCITVETSNVTIDLNGHTLRATAMLGAKGICANSTTTNITVTNGIVRDLASGIWLEGTYSQIINIKALQNGNYGIYAASHAKIADSIAVNNGLDGIQSTYGSLMTGNIAAHNGWDGINAGWGCTIIGNIAYGNIQYAGIVAVKGCTIIDNTVYGNTWGISADAGCTVKDNTVLTNANYGIIAQEGCQVVGNTCKENGFGIIVMNGFGNGSSNMVENNLLVSNNTGLSISIGGNYFANNKAHGNTLDYFTTGGGRAGTGDNANISFYFQPNFVIQQIAGFDIPNLDEAEVSPIRSIRW